MLSGSWCASGVSRVAPGGARWHRAQTSNGYRPTLPAGFARRLAALRPHRLAPAPAPLPDDEVQHRAQHAADQQRLRRQLSCRELAETSLSRPLARALARLGAAIDARESFADPATPSHPD